MPNNNNIISDSNNNQFEKKTDKLSKATMTLLLGNHIIDDFEKLAVKFFSDNDALHLYSGANFYRYMLINFHYYFLSKNGNFHDITEKEISFMKKLGRKRVDINDFGYRFYKNNSRKMTFTIERVVINHSYFLGYNYFFSEKKDTMFFYSLPLFFYDMVTLIKTNKISMKFYSIEELNDWIKSL